MPVPNYSYSVPILRSGLQTLADMLLKAEHYARENNIPSTTLVNATIPPDKKPLSHQVNGATRITINFIGCLTDAQSPALDGKLDTLEDLHTRVTECIRNLERAGRPEAFTKDDTSDVIFAFEQTDRVVSAQQYVRGFVLPDFFFHLGNAFTILKIQGVPLSKADYLQNFIA